MVEGGRIRTSTRSVWRLPENTIFHYVLHDVSHLHRTVTQFNDAQEDENNIHFVGPIEVRQWLAIAWQCFVLRWVHCLSFPAIRENAGPLGWPYTGIEYLVRQMRLLDENNVNAITIRCTYSPSMDRGYIAVVFFFTDNVTDADMNFFEDWVRPALLENEGEHLFSI